LLTSAEFGLTPGAEQFRPVVALMRRDFIPPAYGFLDALFCELLARGSKVPALDAKQLTAELDRDSALADAVHDEYVAAYSKAVAVSHQTDKGMPRPTGVWCAALPTQTSGIRAFVRALKVGVIPRLAPGAVPPSLVRASTKQQVLAIKKEVLAGELLAADHDVVWGHLSRIDATAILSAKHKSTNKAVESMVRRHRGSKPSLGIQSRASTRGGKAWLNQVRCTLWLQRLLPLHPPQLMTSSLDRTARALTTARDRVAARKTGSTRVPRKTNYVPERRQDIEHLLPGPLWNALAPLLPEALAPSTPSRDVLLGILVVQGYGIPWGYLPRSLGLGSGQMVKRRLDRWSKSGVWARVQRVLHELAPALSGG